MASPGHGLPDSSRGERAWPPLDQALILGKEGDGWTGEGKGRVLGAPDPEEEVGQDDLVEGLPCGLAIGERHPVGGPTARGPGREAERPRAGPKEGRSGQSAPGGANVTV